VVDASLGTKRTCPACGTRFYDLNKNPIECPSCHEKFTVEPILPSKQDQMAEKPEEVAPEPVEDVVADVQALGEAFLALPMWGAVPDEGSVPARGVAQQPGRG